MHCNVRISSSSFHEKSSKLSERKNSFLKWFSDFHKNSVKSSQNCPYHFPPFSNNEKRSLKCLRVHLISFLYHFQNECLSSHKLMFFCIMKYEFYEVDGIFAPILIKYQGYKMSPKGMRVINQHQRIFHEFLVPGCSIIILPLLLD